MIIDLYCFMRVGFELGKFQKAVSKKDRSYFFSFDKQFQVVCPKQLQLLKSINQDPPTLICFSPLPFLAHSFFCLHITRWLRHLQISCLNSRQSKHRRGKAKADGRKGFSYGGFAILFSKGAVSQGLLPTPHWPERSLMAAPAAKAAGYLTPQLTEPISQRRAGREGTGNGGQTRSDTFRTKGDLDPHILGANVDPFPQKLTLQG